MSTTAEHQGDEVYLRVSEAKMRYFGGAMSLRWWYKQVESGRLPHFRAGSAVLLREADVEAFVAETFREAERAAEPAVMPTAAQPTPAPPDRSRQTRPGLRFFAD